MTEKRITTDDILQHYGVKGMKWGIRRYQPYPKGEKHRGKFIKKHGEPGKRTDKQKAKVEKTIAKALKKDYDPIDHYNEAAKKMDYDKFNSKWESTFEGYTDWSESKDYSKYVQDANDTFQKVLNETGDFSNLNSIGFDVNFVYDGNKNILPEFYVKEREFKHTSLGKKLDVKFDSRGKIISIRYGGDTMRHVTKDDTLQHHGVKGMKWGIRRYQPYPKGEKHKGKFMPKTRKRISESRVGQEYRSRKREFENMSVSDYTPEMSTKEIKSRNQRMELENSMKKLVDSPRSRNANIRKMQEDAKKDYRNRARMSDEEIKRKVDRLQAIENLNQNANKQGKTLKKIGEKIANASSAMMITALTDESASIGDMVDLMSDPDKALDKVYKKQMSQSSITTEDILQHKGIKDKVF